MQIISKIRNLFILLAAGLCFLYLSVAMDTETITFYRTDMLEKREEANTAADAVRLAHDKMVEIGAKYDASKDAFSGKNTQLVHEAYGVTKDVFTGGDAGVLSGVVKAFTSTSMTEEEKEAILASLGGTPLVDAYTSAIEDKKSKLAIFDSWVAGYNAAFTAWAGVLSAHDKWDEHEGYSVPTTHAADRLYTWKSNWSIDRTLPSFSCGGPCSETFDTPRGDHWETCGYGLHVTFAAWDVVNQIKAQNSNEEEELRNTYGDATYDACVNNTGRFVVGHIESVILKNRSVYEGCGRGYYSCSQNSADLHAIRTCVEQRTWVDENGNEMNAGTCNDQFRNCIGHSVDHDPTDDDTDEQAQNPQTPSPSPSPTPSTPSYHACGVHETSVSGDHSLQAGCGVTNAWGHACTTSYYACQSHTHTYPTFSCGRASCTEQVADPEEHRRRCINGHKYWSCNEDKTKEHKTRTCVRTKWVWALNPDTGEYEAVMGVCNESWARCDLRCRDALGGTGDHRGK